MNIIHKEASCENCFKCIRNCAVKAMLFRDGQARILGNQCVLCGKCINICPQKANHMPSQLKKVKERISRGERILISVDPAYVAAFPGFSFSQLSLALKKLGFWRVEESASGAAAATREYARLLQKGNMPNIITTNCLGVVQLIEKYYPERVAELAPVAPPEVLHARMARQAYGENITVVHLTGCLTKLRHILNRDGIDNVLLFSEVSRWLSQQEVMLDCEDTEPVETWAVKNRKYVLPGGSISNLPREIRKDYLAISVDGFERCMTTLESIEKYNERGFLFELFLCDGGCVSAPAMPDNSMPFVNSKAVLYRMANSTPDMPQPESERAEIDASAHYSHTRIPKLEVSEKEIQAVLHQIGKDTPESLLDCGCCGYNTCREKAIAVCQGRADLHMCLPYLRMRAESMSNLILDNTPNATLVIDLELRIQGCNKAAQKMFGKTSSEMMNTPIYDLIPIPQLAPDENMKLRPDFSSVIYSDQHRELIMDVLMVATSRKEDYIMIARDITQESKNRDEIKKISRETIETTQKVIDKQMRVAQEIASLLGETTGETKAAISKLQRSLMSEDIE